MPRIVHRPEPCRLLKTSSPSSLLRKRERETETDSDIERQTETDRRTDRQRQRQRQTRRGTGRRSRCHTRVEFWFGRRPTSCSPLATCQQRQRTNTPSLLTKSQPVCQRAANATCTSLVPTISHKSYAWTRYTATQRWRLAAGSFDVVQQGSCGNVRARAAQSGCWSD